MNAQYDRAFEGGGFMQPSQATQATDSGFTSTKNRDSQTLLPVTVKQINEAYGSSDDKSNFVIDGVDVNNITLVGMVFNKAERHTEVSFNLDDGTGRLECHRWMNGQIDSKEMEEIQDGMYIRIHGHLKGFQGRTHFVVFAARSISNFNEIAYHFLQCIYVHAYNTKAAQTMQTTQSYVTNPSNAINGSTVDQFTAQYGLDGLSKKVLEYIFQPQFINCEVGANTDQMSQHLKVPLGKIMEAIRFLEAEGAIYSTIDDNHYKSAING